MHVLPIPASHTHDLRRRVLRNNDPHASVDYPHDHDETTAHIGCFDGEKLVAVGSVYRLPMKHAPDDGRTWQFRGMASEPDMRGQGFGAAVLAAIIAHAREHGARLLWCNARVGAVAFYEKFGMSVTSQPFDMPGIGMHVVMELRLGD